MTESAFCVYSFDAWTASEDSWVSKENETDETGDDECGFAPFLKLKMVRISSEESQDVPDDDD